MINYVLIIHRELDDQWYRLLNALSILLEFVVSAPDLTMTMTMCFSLVFLIICGKNSQIAKSSKRKGKKHKHTGAYI